MKTRPWEKLDDFRNLNEFNRFSEWMNEQVQSGQAEELPVGAPYIGATTFREKWFRHVPTGRTWRLVWPDGPFTGLFEPVE